MSKDFELFAAKLRSVIEYEGISQKEGFEKLRLTAERISKQTGDPKYQKDLDIAYNTFRKILRGQYLKGRFYLLAEIVSIAFSIEGVGEEDYTDSSLDLPGFRQKLGMVAVEADDSTIRQVRKVIFLIKARNVENTPLLLNYFSSDWQMLLFPNVNIPEPEDAENVLRILLSERLRIDSESLNLDYRPDSARMCSQTQKETADIEKTQKYGRLALYTFHYCPVQIADPPDKMLKPRFEIIGTAYQWSTLNELKANNQIRHHNNDVLEFLSREYDATLFHLPVSFEEKVDI